MFQNRIAAIYRKNAPSKVSTIPKLLQKHEENEHTLYLKICKKYKVKKPKAEYVPKSEPAPEPAPKPAEAEAPVNPNSRKKY